MWKVSMYAKPCSHFNAFFLRFTNVSYPESVRFVYFVENKTLDSVKYFSVMKHTFQNARKKIHCQNIFKLNSDKTLTTVMCLRKDLNSFLNLIVYYKTRITKVLLYIYRIFIFLRQNLSFNSTS